MRQPLLITWPVLCALENKDSRLHENAAKIVNRALEDSPPGREIIIDRNGFHQSISREEMLRKIGHPDSRVEERRIKAKQAAQLQAQEKERRRQAYMARVSKCWTDARDAEIAKERDWEARQQLKFIRDREAKIANRFFAHRQLMKKRMPTLADRPGCHQRLSGNDIQREMIDYHGRPGMAIAWREKPYTNYGRKEM
jgi:hypothetical protein